MSGASWVLVQPYQVRDAEMPGEGGWRSVVRERRNSSALYRWLRMVHLIQSAQEE